MNTSLYQLLLLQLVVEALVSSASQLNVLSQALNATDLTPLAAYLGLPLAGNSIATRVRKKGEPESKYVVI